MNSNDTKGALDHDAAEIWAFLEARGLLKVVIDGGGIRLLLDTGKMIGATLKDLESLLTVDRSRLRQEFQKNSGRKAFVGFRTTFNNFGGGQVFQTSDPTPHYEIVGRNKARLEELEREWQALNSWKLDIQKLLNFVAGGVVDIPNRFLPTQRQVSPRISKENNLMAEAFVAVCERERTTHPSLQQLKEQTSIPVQTISRKLKEVGTLSAIRRLVIKKINYTKANNEDRKSFWVGVDLQVSEMVESVAQRRHSQRERPNNRLGDFVTGEDESE